MRRRVLGIDVEAEWQEFPGCPYGDATPEGEQAVFQPGDGGHRQPKFLTHAGDLPVPNDGTDWPLYHFITNVPRFQIVGKSQHFDPITWHWAGIEQGWQRLGPTNGVNGAIFDGRGMVRRIEPGAGVTSQGYRYVAPSGEPVLGDLTRIPKFGIIEWIDLSDDQDGGLLVGQSTDGADHCVVRIEGVIRVVQPGRCTFIRARRTGQKVAIALFTTRLSDARPVPGVLIVRATLAQLKTLPELPERTITIEPVDRELWFGCYEFAKPESALGNCFAACDPIGRVSAHAGELTLPTILATRAVVNGPVIGQYIIGGTVDEIEANARLTPHRVVAYWDKSREWPRLPQLPSGALTGIRAYCLKDETPEALERSLRGVISRMPSHRIALICQGYSSNTDLTSDLAGIVPVYARLAKMPQVEMLLVFSDAGRKTGLTDHPEVRALWQQVANSIRPPRISLMKPPIFRILEPTFPLTVELREGEAWRRRFVAEYDPAGGTAEWIQWQVSSVSKDGPWESVTNAAWDLDHHFEVRSPGSYWFRARAWNSAGTHQTGLERKLTVTRKVGQPQPEPEPTPQPQPQPPTADVVFKTAGKDDGTPFWLSVGPDGLIEAKATSADADNVARIVATKDGDLWTLKVGEKFIRAKHGGGSSLFADRDVAGPDEHFTLTRGGDGLWTIQTRTSQFAHAEFGGGGRVVANKTTAGAHEFFDAPIGGTGSTPTAPSIVKRTGVVRRNGKCYADDAGPYLAYGFSLFAAGSLYRDNRAGLDEDCGNMAARGANCVRWMGEVGKPLFEGRELDPTASDYEDIVRGNVAYMYDRFGLRSNFVIFGGTDWNRTAAQREAQVDRIARMFQDLKVAIQSVQIVNEGWQTYRVPDADARAHIREMARRLKSQLDVLVSTTDVPSGEVIGDFYTGTVADIGAQHPDRGDAEDGFRPGRIMWEAREDFPPIWSNEEPRGPKSSVRSEEDPTRLVADMINSYLSGFGEYILHSGAGVTSGGPNDTHVQGEKRLFDHPTMRETADAMGAAVKNLPPDLPNWTRHNWHWAGHPFVKSLELFDAGGRRIGQDFNNPEDRGRGMVCHFSAVQHDRWISAPTGIHHRVVLRPRQAVEFDVHHHRTWEVLDHVAINQDQTHTLRGPEEGGDKMYILTGRFR